MRFLKEGCKLGGMAIEMRLGGIDGGEGEEGWKSLSDQLYRRWELLGICHLKIGDRGVGYLILSFMFYCLFIPNFHL